MSLINQLPPITVQDLDDLTLTDNTNNTISLSPYSITSGTNYAYNNTAIGGLNGTSANAVWTTTGTGTRWQSAVGSVQVSQSATISLKGEDADIDINGKSMKAWMEKVEERLNILTPNPELEKEWDELRKLGERYRKLEKKCKEKSEVWNRLKKV